MIFTGHGLVWNPKKNKPLVNFKDVDNYETSDEYEIELLNGALLVECILLDTHNNEDQESGKMTKKDVMESLDASGIEYNPRDKKEVLLKLLEE